MHGLTRFEFGLETAFLTRKVSDYSITTFHYRRPAVAIMVIAGKIHYVMEDDKQHIQGDKVYITGIDLKFNTFRFSIQALCTSIAIV